MSFSCLSASHHSFYVCSYESFSCKCFSYVCVSCMSACPLVHFHTCPYSCMSFTCLYDYTFHCFTHLYLSFSFFLHVTFHLSANLFHSFHLQYCPFHFEFLDLLLEIFLNLLEFCFLIHLILIV